MKSSTFSGLENHARQSFNCSRAWAKAAVGVPFALKSRFDGLSISINVGNQLALCFATHMKSGIFVRSPGRTGSEIAANKKGACPDGLPGVRPPGKNDGLRSKKD
jgi:hypothetical protein